MELIGRLFRAPATSFFLFGPRGTGKSTWLHHHYPDAVFVDLLDPETQRAYLARPERLREVVEGNLHASTIVVDEVQKNPALLDVVHQLVERKDRSARQFILTGSSSRKLKRAGVDLLAGRLLLKTLYPFMAAELGPAFNLTRALELGMLPLVLASADPKETLRSYAFLYLREEVQTEGIVRNVGAFSRFLEAMSLSHGSLLNISAVARECEVGRKAVEGYVEILEDLLLGFRLRPFTKRVRRRTATHPKFYYVDTGVFRSLRPKGPLDAPQDIGGVALEGLVAQHLRAWIGYTGGDHELHFWRTRAGVEVDFVVYGEDTFAAIEVKSTRSANRQDLKGLLAFRRDYPQAQVCLLYGGTERLSISGIPCLPCEAFLRGLTPNAPFPIP